MGGLNNYFLPIFSQDITLYKPPFGSHNKTYETDMFLFGSLIGGGGKDQNHPTYDGTSAILVTDGANTYEVAKCHSKVGSTDSYIRVPFFCFIKANTTVTFIDETYVGGQYCYIYEAKAVNYTKVMPV